MSFFEYMMFGYLLLFIIKYALFFRSFDKWTMIVGDDQSGFMVYLVVTVVGAIYTFITLPYLLYTERVGFFFVYSDEFLEGIRDAVKEHGK